MPLIPVFRSLRQEAFKFQDQLGLHSRPSLALAVPELSQGDDSAVKGLCRQACRPEFNPWDTWWKGEN